MSFVLSTIPTAAATALPTQTRIDPAQNTSQLATTTGVAVQSASSKSRTVSSGANKQVDSSFESERYNTAKKEKSSEKSEAKSNIYVVA